MRELMRCAGLTVFLLMLLAPAGYAQQLALARTYGIEEGLSHPYIEALDTDSRGNLWVGNRRGLQRFNGFDFKTYFSGSNVISVSCQSNDVFYVTEKGLLHYLHYDNTEYTTRQLRQLPACNGDSYQVLAENDQYFWYSVCDKLFVYNLADHSSTPVALPEHYESIKKLVRSSGGIVVKTNYGMIHLFCDRSRKKPVVTSTKEVVTYRTVPNYAVLVKDNYAYSFKNDTLFRVNLGTMETEMVMQLSNPGLVHSVALVIDKEDQIYFADQTRVGIYNMRTRQFSYPNFRMENGIPVLPFRFYYALYSPQRGIIWYGTPNGLVKHVLHNYEMITHYVRKVDNRPDIPHVKIRSVYELDSSTLFLGTEENGLLKAQPDKHGNYHYTQVDLREVNTNSVNYITCDSKGRLWVGSNGPLTIYDPVKNRFIKNYLNHQHLVWHLQEADGYMWYIALGFKGTRLAGFKNFRLGRINLETLEMEYIMLPEEKEFPYGAWRLEPDGDYYIIPSMLGIHYVNRRTFRFEYPARYQYLTDLMKGQRVWDIHKLDQDRFMVTSQTSGLYIVNLRTRSSEHFMDGLGLYGAVMNGYYAWISSDKGLVQFNCNTYSYRFFDRSDGLITDQLSYLGNHIGASGKLYVCGDIGFSVVNPSLLKVDQRQSVYSLQISELSGQREFEPLQGSTLTLDYKENNLSFDFAPIDFGSHINQMYSWKLEGWDQEWSIPANRRYVSYSNLPPGEYVFRIKNLTAHSLTPHIDHIVTLVITPPFWKTPWFMALFILAMSAALLATFYLWIRSITIRHRREQNLLETQIMALRSQINPHFMFNALNSIQHYMFTNNREEANHYLGQLSSLVRKTLDFTSRQTIPISDEVAYLQNYLLLEEMRFEERLSWELMVDEDVSEEDEIPSLLIQPFVENAIIHGISPLKEGGRIYIRFSSLTRENHSYVQVTVSDNGVGIENSAPSAGHRSKGIGLIEERMQFINKQYHTEGYIEFVSGYMPLPGKRYSTTVRLTIPVL